MNILKKRLFLLVTAIIVALATAYAVAGYLAHQRVAEALQQWAERSHNNSQFAIKSIQYGKVEAGGFFYFTHTATIHDVRITLKPIQLTTKLNHKLKIKQNNQTQTLQLPTIEVASASFTYHNKSIKHVQLEGIRLIAQDLDMQHKLRAITAMLGGEPQAYLQYSYFEDQQSEDLNFEITADDHTILHLTETGSNVRQAYNTPNRWRRALQAQHSLQQTMRQLQQDIVQNPGHYQTELNIDLPHLTLPQATHQTLTELGYQPTLPIAIKFNSQIYSAQKQALVQLSGSIAAPDAARLQFSNHFQINNQNIAQALATLSKQTQSNHLSTEQKNALALRLAAIESRNIFLKNFELSYDDHSLLPRIYEASAKQMPADSDSGIQPNAQDVATFYAAMVQSLQLNPILVPYQTKLAQFIQDPKSLKLTLQPSNQLSLFDIFFLSTHEQEAELMQALNSELDINQA